LSLARPEQVRFRYRLNGYDRAWTEAGPRREAYFTNLPPGTYRFEAMAANPSGVWSESAAGVTIEIPALFVQTRAFVVLCVAAAIALLGIAYALRVRYLTARERSRLEERLVERERIARELHDTLLQGVQGIILGFQSVADQIAPQDRGRLHAEQTLERANALLIEGRERVKNLRGAVGGADSLHQALLDEAAQVAAGGAPHIVVMERGERRAVHPIAHEEVVRIAREALTNAVRHAAASRIDVELRYDTKSLTLAVRDDGKGIAAAVLDGGREGHFGLMGMRERAQRVGGELTVTSIPGTGTRVTLIVPARVAFVGPRWWRRFALT
jgi:signal transduction histidine kinase